MGEPQETGKKRSGPGRVKDRVGLAVALCAGLALHPHQIAAGIHHQVEFPWRAADANLNKVLTAALVKPGKNVRAKVNNVMVGRRKAAVKGVDSQAVAAEEVGDSVAVGGIDSSSDGITMVKLYRKITSSTTGKTGFLVLGREMGRVAVFIDGEIIEFEGWCRRGREVCGGEEEDEMY